MSSRDFEIWLKDIINEMDFGIVLIRTMCFKSDQKQSVLIVFKYIIYNKMVLNYMFTN